VESDAGIGAWLTTWVLETCSKMGFEIEAAEEDLA
jgi:hypothetical protein